MTATSIHLLIILETDFTSVDNKSRKNDAMRQVRIVEAILRRWNPIGLEPGEDWPADEYDRYAPPIVTLVAAGCSIDDLARHLAAVSTDSIGRASAPEDEIDFAREIITALRS